MPDQVYNWIRDFCSGHWHCTKLGGEVSSFLDVTESIIQGSGLGSASHTVNAADLCPRHAENAIVKYADDTYLIIPGAYSHTHEDEVSNVETWAAGSQEQLTAELFKVPWDCFPIASDSRKIRASNTTMYWHWASWQYDNTCGKMTILGVLVNNSLTATDHVSTVLASCASLMYALCVLRSQGLSEQLLKDAFQATVVGKLSYCAPAWSGFCSAADCTRHNSFLRHCDKLGYME